MGSNNPCTNVCKNDGICQMSGYLSQPMCYCTESWAGEKCELPSSCASYCENGGTCAISDSIRYCQCTSGFEGRRCELVKQTENVASNQESSYQYNAVAIIMAAVIIVGVSLTVCLVYLLLKRNQAFTHERLQENDFSNPIFQERDAEPFTLNSDKVRMNY